MRLIIGKDIKVLSDKPIQLSNDKWEYKVKAISKKAIKYLTKLNNYDTM